MTALNESDRRHIEYLEKRRPEREKIVEANELARDLRGLVVFLDDEVAKSVMQALDRDGPWQALKVIPVDALSDAREQRKAARAEMANVELRTPSTNGTGEHDWVRDEPGSEPGNTRNCRRSRFSRHCSDQLASALGERIRDRRGVVHRADFAVWSASWRLRGSRNRQISSGS